MKKIVSLLSAFIMFISPLQCFATELEKPIEPPKVEAAGAILMDYNTGRVLWEKNSQEPLSMASTTKIMTAIITIENRDLNEMVTVSSKAAAAPRVKMYLQKDEEISLKALMYALMLQSSNDAAVAIAEHVGGSVENFCSMMTKKARDIGAKDTVFKTPNGLDADNHHSTAYDLALITRYALNNRDFLEIINTNNITFTSNIKQYDINNKNRFLNEFQGANGVKTGFTGKAGHCFVGSAKQDNMQLISVVLASGWGQKGKEQKWIDTKKIMDYGFKNFEYVQVLEENMEAGNIEVLRSKEQKVGLYTKEELIIPLSKEEKESLNLKIDIPESLKAPVEKDGKIGIATLVIKNKPYAKIDILAKNEIKRFDIKTCTESIINNYIQMATRSDIDIELPEIFEIIE